MSADFDRVPVDSSSISSIGYLKDDGILEIQFRNGRVYRLFLVPATVWANLLQSESKGAFFNRFIRDRYPHVLVPPDAPDHLIEDLRLSLEALKSRGESEDPPLK